MKSEIDIDVRLQLIGISIEELESCKNKIEQKALVRKATRKKIKYNKTHPDISKDVSYEVANKITSEIFSARDDILKAIDNNKFRVNIQVHEDVKEAIDDDVFINMVNDNNHKHKEQTTEEWLDEFAEDEDRLKEKQKKQEENINKKGISNAIVLFNDKFFTIRDAIRKLKDKVKSVFKGKEDEIDR